MTDNEKAAELRAKTHDLSEIELMPINGFPEELARTAAMQDPDQEITAPPSIPDIQQKQEIKR